MKSKNIDLKKIVEALECLWVTICNEIFICSGKTEQDFVVNGCAGCKKINDCDALKIGKIAIDAYTKAMEIDKKNREAKDEN